MTSYLKNPFFRAWHPSVLKIYIEAGIYDTTDEAGNSIVKLKMPGIYESVVFSERTVGQEVWQNLPNIPERIPIRWVVPDRSDADEFGPPGATRERCWIRPKNASNIKIPGAGHLVCLFSCYRDRGHCDLTVYSCYPDCPGAPHRAW